MNKQQTGMLVKHLNQIIERVQSGDATDAGIDRTTLYKQPDWYAYGASPEETGERVVIDVTFGRGGNP